MTQRRRIRSDDKSAPPYPVRTGSWRARLAGFELRDLWWRTLDYFEAKRRRRVILYLAGFSILIVGALRLWVYPWWTERNAIRIAQQWLEAGQLANAAEAAQRAAAVAPHRPEPWQIATELARRGGQKEEALRFARRAAELAPGDPVIAVTLAAVALNAGQPEEATAALAQVAPATVAASPEAQRVLGEIARRELRFTIARDHFEAARQLDGPKAINDVPLGLVLVRSNLPAERERAQALLTPWVADDEWGPAALRALLGDAIGRNDPPAMVRWAEALRAHPRVLVADMPTWLLALSRADESRYTAALVQLQKDHAVSPEAAAQLLGWLNQIGRSRDALAWLGQLPAPALQRPPLAVHAAEAYRATSDWAGLLAWTDAGDWGPDANFLRWCYGLVAARALPDTARADELWRTLYNHAQINTGNALFAASTLYGWGLATEAEALWWRAAAQDGTNAIEALGALARLYQVKRDADGQYRAFRRLHLLQPSNIPIANNFAFFALLLGREQRLAEQVARANLEREPDNPDFLATHAFAFVQQGRFADALAALKPKAHLAGSSPGIAFVYGTALAGAGRRDEARAVLPPLASPSLTGAEVDLIKRLLGE